MRRARTTRSRELNRCAAVVLALCEASSVVCGTAGARVAIRPQVVRARGEPLAWTRVSRSCSVNRCLLPRVHRTTRNEIRHRHGAGANAPTRLWRSLSARIAYESPSDRSRSTPTEWRWPRDPAVLPTASAPAHRLHPLAMRPGRANVAAATGPSESSERRSQRGELGSNAVELRPDPSLYARLTRFSVLSSRRADLDAQLV